MNKEWQRLWDLMLKTQFGLWATLDAQLLEKHQLPALWFHTLLALHEAPQGYLRVQELACEVRHSQSGTTRLVDRLEKEGLVERHACPEDRRAINTALSEKGRKVIEEAKPLWDNFLTRFLADALTPSDGQTLIGLLERLQAVAGKDLGTCPTSESVSL